MTTIAALLLPFLTLAMEPALQQQSRPPTPPEGANVQGAIEAEVTGHVLRPEKVDASPERIAAIDVPAGFRISVWAD